MINLLVTLLAVFAVLAIALAAASLVLWAAWRVPQCAAGDSACSEDIHTRDGACLYAPGGRLADPSLRGFIRDLRAACAAATS